MKCTNIYLSRHGVRPSQVPAGFPTGEPYDGPKFDEPLSSLGRQQAEALAERMADVPIDFIFCSPFLRTIQTVAPLARKRGLPIKLEWGLGEFLKASWFDEFPPLPTLEERHVQFPEVDLTYQSMVIPTFPEDEDSFERRITNAATALTQNFGPSLFLMGHGASSSGLRRVLLGDDTPLNSDYCAVSQLSRTGESWNYEQDGDSEYLKARGIYVPMKRR